MLGSSLPRHGSAPDSVVELLANAGTRGTVASVAQRYFGFVIGGSLPVAVAADWLVSAWDQNAGIYAL